MTPFNTHGQEQPTEQAALNALAELLGPEWAAGVWDVAARSLNVTRPVDSVADLREMAEQMMTAGELMRVAGRSLKIRAITYEALSRTTL